MTRMEETVKAYAAKHTEFKLNEKTNQITQGAASYIIGQDDEILYKPRVEMFGTPVHPEMILVKN